eukprot:Mycagemm_TRINITY_DN10294_c0_g2::TRINITY_DN10294_c0_g2_i3::g.3671::m.3671 type:complete len:123 gc:universal TRINITY_DN10294_c0_g2_i3:1108-740(-)
MRSPIRWSTKDAIQKNYHFLDLATDSRASRSASIISWTLIGFVRYRKNPACIPLSMSRGMALALSAMTGRRAVTGSLRRILNASKPLMSGRLMSMSTTSGCILEAISMPVLPVTAVSRRTPG